MAISAFCFERFCQSTKSISSILMGIPQAQMTNFDIRNISVYLRIANLERETANNYHNTPNSHNVIEKQAGFPSDKRSIIGH